MGLTIKNHSERRNVSKVEKQIQEIFDSETKVRIDHCLAKLVLAVTSETYASVNRDFETAQDHHNDVMRIRDEIYSILGMEEYKINH